MIVVIDLIVVISLIVTITLIVHIFLIVLMSLILCSQGRREGIQQQAVQLHLRTQKHRWRQLETP
jgi:hypothetical protein